MWLIFYLFVLYNYFLLFPVILNTIIESVTFEAHGSPFPCNFYTKLPNLVLLSIYLYRKPGVYLLHIEVRGAFDEVFSYETKIEVETKIEAQLHCPEHVLRDEEFQCTIHTLMGDNITLLLPHVPGK